MVIIFSVHNFQMNIHHCTVRYGIEEFFDHFGIQLTDILYRKFCIIFQIRTSGKIYCTQCQCLVHRKNHMPEPLDSGFISYRFQNCLSDYDSGILYGVMTIHIQISIDLYGKIEQPMSCHSVQHMIKKSNSCIDLIVPGSIKIQCYFNVSFFCCTFLCCYSCHIFQASLFLKTNFN